ncbi:MAG: NAD(P)/FAD-dependent oxidoreductase [Ruminococcus sp.]|nr:MULTISPECIES: NAD(P)/FAD-dependent oxidoreductase [Ruminococcus]MDD6708963.1 NAD(P)/FAD-dependent oxidoreductase [Ruminococcus sp.]MDY3661427.1 NAD(P)/FAD-dependent oxidoreductase [Ruminococcus bovis]
MPNVVVIGGGASGLMAAGTASYYGANVTLLEKNSRTGRKILVTGKGRCNITNNCDKDTFIANVPTNPRFLYSAINNFDCQDTIDFFNDLGLETKTERGNRVFPVSDKAMDVADTLYTFAKYNGVKIIESTAKVILTSDGKVSGVLDTKGNKYDADCVIIATGGMSYPGTGSTGDGYKLAKTVGHTITEIKPSLVGLISSDEFCKELQGLSLKNVNLTAYENGKEIFSEQGEMLFTHQGVSGPLVLSASSHMRNFEKKSYKISIDLKPALSEEKLDLRLQKDFSEHKNNQINNSLGKLLPKKIIPVVLKMWGIDPTKKCNSITKEERQELNKILKNFTVKIKSLGSIKEAIITSGGVSTKEISPKTMESKILSGLFFCGEVIDVDAYTGGFNLQIAFSTGRLAGYYSAIKEG